MTPIRVLLAHSSSPAFGGMGEPWAAVDHRLNSTGARVAERILLDNADSPMKPELPSGWVYRPTPESFTEFDAWSSALIDADEDVRHLLVTGAIGTRRLRGSLVDAMNDPRASGHLVARFSPHQIDGVWLRAFIGTSALVLPQHWSGNTSLSRWTLSELDPTYDPLSPFGTQASVPSSILTQIMWWLTWRWSEYGRATAPTPEGMNFFYRKALSMANEIAVGPRLLVPHDEDERAPRLRRDPHMTFGPVTADVIFASPHEVRALNSLGPNGVTRTVLTYRSARRLARLSIDQLLAA